MLNELASAVKRPDEQPVPRPGVDQPDRGALGLKEAAKNLGRYLWNGPQGLSRGVQLEWRFVAIRWLGIAFVAPALAIFDLTPEARIAAFGVLAAAVLYNLVLQIVMSRHAYWFANGFVTTGCDAALNIGMIMVAGGFDTPFYFILYTVTISAAMRYGYGPAFAVSCIFVVFDFWEGLVLTRALDAGFIFRSGFLIITAVMAGYLQEQARRAQTELQDRLRDAQALNEELESFSYSVSHDLRAPLRTIDGFSAIVLEDYGNALEPEVHDYLNRMRAASQRMARLIDDLLDLSRVTRKDITYDRVNLSQVAREVLAELGERDPQRQVNVSVQAGLFAHGDPDLLRLVFENLLANAWKFTGKEPEAAIQVGGDHQDGRTVFFIRDNGAGFEPEYASKLFRIFQRLHKDSEFEGTGIGLATVRRIIRRHGGDIWAEGAIGKGATFSFTLPPHRLTEVAPREQQRTWLLPPPPLERSPEGAAREV